MADPEIDRRTEWLVSRGRWSVPGYKVCIFHQYYPTSSLANTVKGKIRGSLDPLDLAYKLFVYPSTIAPISVHLYQ